MIRLLIADDDPIVREGLRMILKQDSDFQVLACVENSEQALAFCLKNQVDVALLDIRMLVLNGVEARKAIVSQTGTKSLILTTLDDDESIAAAIQYGAQGYLLKNTQPEKIKDAIRMVNGGHTVVQKVNMDKLKEGLSAPKKTGVNPAFFSKREYEVIELIAEGLSNKKIAEKLYIS